LFWYVTQNCPKKIVKYYNCTDNILLKKFLKLSTNWQRQDKQMALPHVKMTYDKHLYQLIVFQEFYIRYISIYFFPFSNVFWFNNLRLSPSAFHSSLTVTLFHSILLAISRSEREKKEIVCASACVYIKERKRKLRWQLSWCQFHQWSTSRFCTRRSRKRKQYSQVVSLLCAFGICARKKLLIEHWYNWHQGSISSTFYLQLLHSQILKA